MTPGYASPPVGDVRAQPERPWHGTKRGRMSIRDWYDRSSAMTRAEMTDPGGGVVLANGDGADDEHAVRAAPASATAATNLLTAGTRRGRAGRPRVADPAEL